MSADEVEACLPVIGEGQSLGIEPLQAFFDRTPKLALAFSGGCDSSYLLMAAAAHCEVGAYYVRTAFQPGFELEDARHVLAEVRRRYPGAKVAFSVLDLDILSQDDICANPPDRCYLCKRFILGAMRRAASCDGYELLIDGTNASDDPARRPGFRALAELGVISPLRRAGMTKEDVRAASRDMNLSTAEKPSFSCLATAVACGEPLTSASLKCAACERGVDGGKRPESGYAEGWG